MTEECKYKTIKKLVETEGNKLRASQKIGCTLRHINRLVKRYKEDGKSGFSHGNKARVPKNRISNSIR